MSGRTQRLKGVANEVAGKTRGSVSHATGNGKGEAKAADAPRGFGAAIARR